MKTYDVFIISPHCPNQSRPVLCKAHEGARRGCMCLSSQMAPKPGAAGYCLIGSANPYPRPDKRYPQITLQELLCAVGVSSSRVYPKTGCISALAGRRAAYERVRNN